jgi:hypothetical protein
MVYVWRGENGYVWHGMAMYVCMVCMAYVCGLDINNKPPTPTITIGNLFNALQIPSLAVAKLGYLYAGSHDIQIIIC